MFKFLPDNLQQILAQAQQMQTGMQNLREDLAKREFDAAAGGGLVTVQLRGDGVLTGMTIDPSLLTAGDATMVQDLVRAAVNEGLHKVKATWKEEMQQIAGGLPISGLFG